MTNFKREGLAMQSIGQSRIRPHACVLFNDQTYFIWTYSGPNGVGRPKN